VCRNRSRWDLHIEDNLVGYMPTIVNWLVQQSVVPVMSLGWAIASSYLVLRIVESLQVPGGRVIESAWRLFGVWGFGSLLGFVIQRRYPDFASSGRFIWVLPTLVFGVLVVKDLAILSVKDVVSEILGGGNQGESGLVGLLVGYPAWSSLSYSGGVYLGRRLRPAL
jgi:hypothetical protein